MYNIHLMVTIKFSILGLFSVSERLKADSTIRVNRTSSISVGNLSHILLYSLCNRLIRTSTLTVRWYRVDPLQAMEGSWEHSAITELVYFIEPHDHLNPVSISKDDCPWRVYDGVNHALNSNNQVGLPSRLTAVVRIFLSSSDRSVVVKTHQLRDAILRCDVILSSNVCVDDEVGCMVSWPGSTPMGSGLLTHYQSINIAISPVWASREFSGGGAYVDFRAEAQLFVGIIRSDDGIVQAGSGVAGLSSVRSFHQLCLKLTVGIRSRPTSSPLEYGVISASGSSSLIKIIRNRLDEDGGGGGGAWAESEAPVVPEAPDAPDGSEGGGGGEGGDPGGVFGDYLLTFHFVVHPEPFLNQSPSISHVGWRPADAYMHTWWSACPLSHSSPSLLWCFNFLHVRRREILEEHEVELSFHVLKYEIPPPYDS
ncbi:hypothetical protein Tco_0844581 [Tanacetum coccineum]